MAIREEPPRRQTPWAAIAIAVATVFGLIAVFISVQNEAPKVWNLSVSLLATTAIVCAVWMWASADAQPNVLDKRRTRLIAVVIGCPALVLGILGIVMNPMDNPDPGTDPVPGSIGLPADVRVHEVWEEGGNAHFHRVAQERWAMTDFVVTEPYVRSMEVNVTGVDKVRLALIRRTGPDEWQPVVYDEPSVEEGRAKVIFKNPVDVRSDMGKRLFLQVFNVADRNMRVYFTTHNVNRSVQGYLWCDRKTASCVHRGEDLNAMVVGWSRPG